MSSLRDRGQSVLGLWELLTCDLGVYLESSLVNFTCITFTVWEFMYTSEEYNSINWSCWFFLIPWNLYIKLKQVILYRISFISDFIHYIGIIPNVLGFEQYIHTHL